MRAVKSRNTKPEIKVRRLLHGMGYRYRLHIKNLAGKPDIVFTSRRKIIFVHGCFWHGHNCKRGNRLPVSNAQHWKSKIERNVKRYADQLQKLTEDGWKVLTLWECELKDDTRLIERLKRFLTNEN